MAGEADIQKLVGRFSAMRALAGRAAQENPQDVRARYGASMAYRLTGDFRAALTELQAALALDPNNSALLTERAAVQEAQGEFEAAADSYAAALRAAPENYRARLGLVQLQKQTLANNSIKQLEAEFALPDPDGWRSLHIGHALAKTFEDLGDPKNAFAWLTKAKQARRALRPYNAAYEEALADAALKLRVRTGGHDTQEPIFVSGLPRTGTTLTDRILSTHAEVESAGEIGNFPQMLKLMSGSTTPPTLDADTLARAGDVDAARLGAAYVESTRPLTGRTPRFIDKAPSNYLVAPVILSALPNARVICMRRHPLDACLSNYKQIFPFDDRYYDYAYGLEEAAHKFVQFERVVRHWREVLPPERFRVVQYEELVSDQEAQTRGLLAFAALPWDAHCLAFHENPSGVATPSARQVRSAMYASAVGRWAKYGDLLDPARRVLEKAGVALD